MEQPPSIEYVIGCEGGGWRFSCQTWGNLNEAQGLLLQTFHRGGKLKREEKILANNSCLSPGSPLHWLQFLISCLQFFRNFLQCLLPLLQSPPLLL